MSKSIPTALEVFLRIEMERSITNNPREHTRDTRVTSAEELGTTSKNKLRGIALGAKPIWEFALLP